MGYRDILVHTPLREFDTQLEVALALTKQFGAHLTGLCCLRETATLKDAMRNPFIHLEQTAEFRNAMDRERDEALQAEHRFRVAAERVGVSLSWQTSEGDPADLIIYACRLQDLAIVEQSADRSDLLWGPAVQVALSGNPTLVIPRSWQGPVSAQRVVVAWNDSAQAAAAVRHALPLLMCARQVNLLAGVSRESHPSSMRAPALDIIGYLRRHGIEATASAFDPVDADAGAGILEAGERADADLIVMGAYGRSRLREWLLGGATRWVLERATVPVFMVH